MADLTRIKDPYDPTRCQAITTQGQCDFKAMEDVTYCIMHSGTIQLGHAEKARISSYNLAKWKVRVAQHTGTDVVKSLHDEIGILKMVLETKLTSCNDDVDLLLAAPAISELVLRINTVVTSLAKMESTLSTHMSKTRLIQFSKQIIDIIAHHVTDGKVIEDIAEDLLAMIEN